MGQIISYAAAERMTATLRFGIVTKAPKRNDSGVWRMQVRLVWEPEHCRLRNGDIRKSNIECSARAMILDTTEAALRKEAAVIDAQRRLDG
ncbi:unnamed protein product [marine sediment metagenome]|uniref:Uncharacterized protein n=1 Tax=marine sediment metagenome TaxID=412755 RepID=X0VU56_9ZZZZ